MLPISAIKVTRKRDIDENGNYSFTVYCAYRESVILNGSVINSKWEKLDIFDTISFEGDFYYYSDETFDYYIISDYTNYYWLPSRYSDWGTLELKYKNINVIEDVKPTKNPLL